MYVKTLSEFIEWVAQFNDGQYLFRGVLNDTFEIQASAYRRLPEAERNNSSRLLKINQRLIEDARSLGHDQKNGEQLSDLELLAELQHFGAGTCLIDFSRSALDALWFACLKNPKKEEGETNGKVFAVRHDDVVRLRTVTPKLIKEDIDYFFQSDENGIYPLYQWAPKLQNNRIIAQHSVFLFGGAQIEVAAKCVIIKSSKQEILKSLKEVSDITEATMYPDFDGFARLHAHDKPYIEPDAQGYLQRGIEAHQNNNNLDDAIAYYTEVISLEPAPFMLYTARHNRGIAYWEKGDLDRAIVDLNEAIELNPDDANAYNNRGNIYHNKGDLDRAIADFNNAIELNPDDANAYYNCGNAYHSKADYVSAIEAFTKAIERNPNFAEAYTNRGIAYHKKGDYDRGIENHNKALQIKPDYAEAYFNRGDVYQDKSEYDRAIVDYSTAIEFKPDFPGAYNHRGVAYRAKGEYDCAIEDFNKAIEFNPNYAEAYNNLGITYRKKGTIDRAIGNHNKAIECEPDFAEAYYNRGLAWLLLKEWERARLDLTTAKERGANIINEFRMDYESVSDFEGKHGIQLPPDIAAMLTPQ